MPGHHVAFPQFGVSEIQKPSTLSMHVGNCRVNSAPMGWGRDLVINMTFVGSYNFYVQFFCIFLCYLSSENVHMLVYRLVSISLQYIS